MDEPLNIFVTIYSLEHKIGWRGDKGQNDISREGWMV